MLWSAVVALFVAGLPVVSWTPGGMPSAVAFAATSSTALAVSTASVGGAPPAQPSAAQRVSEVEGWRTRTAQTFALDTGGFETVISAGSVHFQDGQEWRAIDNTLLPQTGGGWRNGANRYDLSLPATGDGPVAVSTADARVAFALEGAAPVPGQAQGDTVRYPQVLAGVDLLVRAGADEAKELLELAGPDSVSAFVYRVSSGLQPRRGAHGRVDFLDAAGRARLAFAAPYMFDATGEQASTSHAVGVDVARDGRDWKVTVTPDRGWLADPARVWPVTVDPTTTLSTTGDCWLSTALSGTHNNCASPYLNVGLNSDGPLRRSTIKFDVVGTIRPLAADGPVEVSVAELGLYRTASAWTPLNLHRLTSQFNGSCATWNQKDSCAGTAWTTPGGDFESTPIRGATTGVTGTQSWTGAAGWDYWYPTRTVQGWLDGGNTERGFLLKSADETINEDVWFASSEHSDSTLRPKLTLHWDYGVGKRKDWTFHDVQLSPETSVSVNVANGNLIVAENDGSLPGTAGHDLVLDRTYNGQSAVGYDEDLGLRWRSTAMPLRLWRYGSDDRVAVEKPGGGRAVFVRSPGSSSYISITPSDAKLTRNSDGTFTLKENKTARQMRYNSGGYLTSVVDRNGNTISYAYSSGKLASITDSQNRVTTVGYGNGQDADRIVTVTDPASRSHSYDYGSPNATNWLSSVTNPAGHTTSYSDGGINRLTRLTDARGNHTDFTYITASDSTKKWRLASIKRITNASTGAGHTTTFGYFDDCRTDNTANDNAVCTIITDPNGHKTTYYTQPSGQVSKVTDALRRNQPRSYSPAGNVATYTNASGAGTTTNTYSTDGKDNLLSAGRPTGSGTTLTSSFAYSNATQAYSPTRATSEQGNQVNFGYDSLGNLNCTNNDQAATATCANSGNGTPVAGQTHVDHNPNGTVSRQIDGRGNITNYGYTYNTSGQLTKTTVDNPAPLGDTTTHYDTLGRVTSTVDGKNQTTSYGYDNLDRTTTVDHAGGTTVDIGYTYDPAGNRSTMTDSTGTTSYTWDALNRLTAESLPGSRTNSYGYDGVGNMTSFTDAGGTVTYQFDEVNRTSKATEGSNSTTFGYDSNDHRTRASYPNGIVQAANADEAGRTNWIAGCPASVLPCDTTRTDALTKFSYTYTNPVGGSDTALRHTQTDRTGNTVTYGYDPQERLDATTTRNSLGTVLASSSYIYDPTGNRTRKVKTDGGTTTTTSYAYNAANQLCWTVDTTSSNTCASTPAGAVTYTFDGNGNQTGNSLGQSLVLNSQNQTTSMRKTTTSTALTAGYTGPGQGNRATVGGTTLTNSLLGLTRAGTTSWTRDPHGKLLGLRAGTTRGYYLTDGLGSIVAITDSTGTVRNRYSYDEYGIATSTCEAAGCLNNPWTYTGAAYNDSTTGLTKLGIRYYDPTLGRFTQPDPTGQDPHYTYAGNNPVNFTDPTGAFTIGASVTVCAGVVGQVCVSASLNFLTGSFSYSAGGGVGFGAKVSVNAVIGGDTPAYYSYFSACISGVSISVYVPLEGGAPQVQGGVCAGAFVGFGQGAST